jgi:hypothetical protein
MRRIRPKVALSGTDQLRDLWVRMFYGDVERWFDCFPSFPTLVRNNAPQGSEPKEGDNVMARLHVTCPGPGNTRIIYSRLATSLRSLAIISRLHYSTILISTCATVSTDIPSYEAIHGCMPLDRLCLQRTSLEEEV